MAYRLVQISSMSDDPATALAVRADKMRIRQWGTIMYRLADIDFSNVLDISLREPMSDEIDCQELEANLRSKSAFSPGRELEQAVFGAA